MRESLRLLGYARRQRTTFILIVVLTLGAAGLSALQPWPMKLLIDHVLGTVPLPQVLRNSLHFFSLEPTGSALLAVIVLSGLALFALNSAVEAALTWSWTKAGRRMVYDLAEEIFARLQRRSLLYHQRTSVGDVMGRVTVDS